MGFSTGSYCTVWNVEDKGRFTDVSISTSRKNKDTGQYDTDFSNFVTFVGEAHQMAANLRKGDRIRLGNCEVRTNFDKEKNIKYYNFTVFSFEPVESKQTAPQRSQYSRPAQQFGDDPF